MEYKCERYKSVGHYYGLIDMGFDPRNAFITVALDVLEGLSDTDNIEEALTFLLTLVKSDNDKTCLCGKGCMD